MASTYTSQPTSTKAPGPQPGPNVLPAITIPAGSDAPTIESITQALEESTDWCGYLNQQPKYLPCSGFDGSVTLDGVVAAPAWATKVGTVYTLTRDTALNNLTVTGAGVVLQTANFRLIGNGTLTTAAGGSVKNTGGAGAAGAGAVGGAGGTAVPVGSLGTGTNGGNGQQNAFGTAGSNITVALGGVGGTGGAGGNAGGNGGTVTAPAANLGLTQLISLATSGYIFSYASPGVWTQLQGGSGAGGGGANGVPSASGGGGAGAGVMVIVFRNIQLANATDIQCIGGAGGAGAGAAGINGGGGGGAGGLLIIVYGNANQTFSAASNCPGGAGGAGAGGGSNGSTGAVGTVINGSLA